MRMITFDDCLKAQSVEESALYFINKITFDYRKGYTKSHDDEDYWNFAANLKHEINKIKSGLNNKKFEFSPCLKITRKMKSNKIRDIYISTWGDKIVERWLNDCLNKLLNNWFSGHSYAYRLEKLGIDDCQNKISKIINHKSCIAKRDITSYFYSIDHYRLLDKIKNLVDENDYLFDLIMQRVRFKYVEDDTVKDSVVGIPFGTAIACTFLPVCSRQSPIQKK